MLTLKASFSFLSLQLLVLFNNFHIIYCNHDIYEDYTPCQQKGNPGICTFIENCPTLNDHFKSTGNLTDDELCSNSDDRMVVCCIDPYAFKLLRVKAKPKGQYENKQRIKRRVVFPNDQRLKEARDRQRFNRTNSDPVISNAESTKLTPSSNIPRTMSTTTLIKAKRPVEIACDNVRAIFRGELLRNNIVGQSERAESGEFPHMAALGYGRRPYEFSCAGTLISDRYVLTAAHCSTRERKPVIVRMGRINIVDDNDADNYAPIDVPVDDVITHFAYKGSEFYNDIALLKLLQPVEFNNYVHPACLYTKTEDLNSNVKLVITGWGVRKVRSSLSNTLRKANVQTVPFKECQAMPELQDKSIPRGIMKSQICAHSEVSDTCDGDSGGPLLIEDKKKVSTVIGITSFGRSCGTDAPGVYTRVAHYLNWIESIVWS